MNLIVNVDLDWGIGREGRLLVHLREDMRRFKYLTTGQVIILGRKTLGTFPRGRPLPDRTNIVLTRDKAMQLEGATLCHSLAELAAMLSAYPADAVFVAGGDSLYRQLLPFCSLAYVTRVHRHLHADAFFPNLDCLESWQLEEAGPLLSGASRLGDPDDLLPFQFCLYRQHQAADLSDWLRERGDLLDAAL